jgi:MFS family permease
MSAPRSVRPDRFGFIAIEPGVKPSAMWTALYASFVNIGIATTVAVMTPYVLSANLGLPIDRQGTALGVLNLVNEAALLLVFSLAGALADRVGRRAVYALGFLATGLGYLLYPLASDLVALSAARVVYAIGIGATTGMLSTVLADYVQQKDRGKIVALSGVLNGLGVIVLALLLGKLPAVFVADGMSERLAGQLALAVAAGVCALSAVVVWLGLRPGAPSKPVGRLKLSQLLTAGVAAGRGNPRIVLAYASAFVARGDLAIVGAYAIAWGKKAALENGATLAEALDKGRIPFIVAQSAALLWPVVIALMIDRVHRLTALAICMALGAVGYLATLLIGDPLSASAAPLFVLLGIGQISAFIGSQALIGKEAPEAERGSVIGLFNLCGAFGILVLGTVGGVMFDAVGPQSPFVLVGALNLVIAIASIVLRARTKKAGAATAPA